MMRKLTLDNAGRVVIPKPLRDELGVGPGDSLQLEAEGQRITLRPLPSTSPLQKERGVWVYRTGQRLPASVVNDVAQEIREERGRAALGRRR